MGCLPIMEIYDMFLMGHNEICIRTLSTEGEVTLMVIIQSHCGVLYFGTCFVSGKVLVFFMSFNVAKPMK